MPCRKSLQSLGVYLFIKVMDLQTAFQGCRSVCVHVSVRVHVCIGILGVYVVEYLMQRDNWCELMHKHLHEEV